MSYVYSVFVLDTGFHVFVWVGKEASSHEKGGGLIIAHVSPTTVHYNVKKNPYYNTVY